MTIAEIVKKAKMIKERLRSSYYETICVRGSTDSTGRYRFYMFNETYRLYMIYRH